MNINELPKEILERILSLLPRQYRLESALTCRLWAQSVARAPILLQDVWLVIREFQRKEVETIFANSHRQYRNLRLLDVRPLDFNAAFWARVGPNLRKLEIIGCSGLPKVFHSILQACPNLEFLKIARGRRGVWFELSKTPPGINLTTIQESMRNLRHLHLGYPTNADTLEHLLFLMPNASSIELALFEGFSDIVRHMPEILGTSHRITMLDIDWYFGSDAYEQLWRISSRSLRKLRCTKKAFLRKPFDALSNCTMLRDLDIHMTQTIDVRLLHAILRNVTELESLSICIDLRSLYGGCIGSSGVNCTFTPEDLIPIVDLRKLRILHLDLDLQKYPDRCISGRFLTELARMLSLDTLTLGDQLGIVDSARLRILARLSKLRNLEIRNLRWDAESFEIVVLDFKKLKTLAIYGHDKYDRLQIHDRRSELRRLPPPTMDYTKFDCQGEQESSLLEILTLEYIPITDACLARLAAHHNRLRVVNFSVCPHITGAGLLTLFQHELFLEELLLVCLFSIDRTFLETLLELCPRLRTLEIKLETKDIEMIESLREEFRLRRPRVECNFY